MNVKRSCLLVIVVICCWVASPSLAQQKVAPGVFLVATEKITSGVFKESVVLLIQHDEQGSLGVVINKPSEMALDKVLPEHGLPKSDATLYFGGPVKPMMVSALSITKRTHPSMKPVLGEIYWTPGLRALAHIVQQIRGEERVRAYMGVSGWGVGQLQQEIAKGDWVIAVAEPDQVLSAEPKGLWQKLYKEWSGRWI